MIKQGYLLSDTSHLWQGKAQSIKTLAEYHLTERVKD
jgi:hypothetical protein